MIIEGMEQGGERVKGINRSGTSELYCRGGYIQREGTISVEIIYNSMEPNLYNV